MDNPELTAYMFYTLLYAFFSVCVVAPPSELVSAGLTVQNLFSSYLGSQELHFVLYHMRRTSVTLIVHSLIPLGYYIGFGCCLQENNLFEWEYLQTEWKVYLSLAFLCPITTITIFYCWSLNNWEQHPIAKHLSHIASEGTTWRDVADSINQEFRRVDKFTSGPHSRQVIITDSWVMKTSTYHVYVAHQNDIDLTLSGTEEHDLSYETSISAVQYLNITVTPINPAIKPFMIRLNSVEYGELREKLTGPIQNVRNVVIRLSLSDQFLVAFREEVKKNLAFILPPGMEVDTCVGCMQKQADVKLQKLCADVQDEQCSQCYCRPMWCLDCMGKWFASRQDQQTPQVWLSGKSPCPTCRRMFCVLDVCYIAEREPS